jgi:hypothetical protein
MGKAAMDMAKEAMKRRYGDEEDKYMLVQVHNWQIQGENLRLFLVYLIF